MALRMGPNAVGSRPRPAGQGRLPAGRADCGRIDVSYLDNSIDKANSWLAEVPDEFGTEDRRPAYRVTRAWLPR